MFGFRFLARRISISPRWRFAVSNSATVTSRRTRLFVSGAMGFAVAPTFAASEHFGDESSHMAKRDHPVASSATLLSAPIELAGDRGHMLPRSAVQVVGRKRHACLDGPP